MSLDDEVGRTINKRYEITRLIGEGGMGVVYEAYDTQVDRKVAIKLVRPETLADRKFMTRFRRELEVTTQLRHPSTIRVFEHGEAEDGRPYMVMELLTGVSLADRLEKGPIPELEALQYARQIAESLSEAHENGIFHRDLKPDNIFIESGRGLAPWSRCSTSVSPAVIDASRLTQAGEVFGTPQYMSPEQCNGLPLDHRTDIYSLGCILYEMIEGRPPFSAESPMATMLKHVKAKVPPPRKCCRETAKVILASLRKDRNKRIQDCGRFAGLLGQAIGAARAAAEGRDDVKVDFGNKRQRSTGPIPTVITGGATTGPIPVGDSGSKVFVAAIAAGVLLIVGAIVFTRGGDDDESSADDKAETAGAADAAGGKTTADDDPAQLPKNRPTIRTNVEDAQVLLDGDLQCMSPCTIEVPVGDGAHEIRVLKEGWTDSVISWEPASVTETLPDLPDMNEIGKAPE